MVLLMQKSLSSEAWAVSGTYHTNLERYFLGGICFTARWCLKSKNCTGWWLSSIAFQSYSVSHFTVSDCVLAFLPWKGKSPHFSQYWKAFLQCVNRPIYREVDPLGFGSTMLFSAIRCILRIVWNTHFQLQRPVIPRDHWFFFRNREMPISSPLVTLDILFPLPQKSNIHLVSLPHTGWQTSFCYLSPEAWLEYSSLINLLYSTSSWICIDH